MARPDIWQDGIETRFSPTHQPANRGRKKGHPNRATIARLVFAYLADYRQEVEQLRRNNRNARRRERYHKKKRAGKVFPQPNEKRVMSQLLPTFRV